jgi:hypothetical protein
MPSVNDYSQLAGIWKDVWGSTVFDPFKFATPLISDMPLEAPASQAGGKYHQPILATQEAGITHAAPRTTPGYNSVPYVNPRAGVIPDAQIEGAQIYGRSLVTYEAIMRSLKDINGSEDDLRKAVKGATRTVVMGLGKAMAKRAEVLALNGGHPDGLGVIEAVGTTPTASVSIDGTSTTGSVLDVSVSAETWAAAIFAQAEGATFDIYSAAGAKLNTANNTYLNSAGGQTGLILVAINPVSPISPVTATGRVLRFWHTVSSAGGVNSTTLAAGSRIFYESGGPATSGSIGAEPIGLSYLASIGTGAFTGGTFPTALYNIDSATYSIWSGNRATGVGNVKIAQLIEQLAAPIDFGVMGEKVRALVPTKLFQQFATDEASLRRYNGAQKKAENGFDAVQYSMGGNNVLEVLGHPYQKGGRVTCYVPSEAHRVGPQDVSFLKRNGNDFALEVGTGAASEARAMGQYNVYVDAPKHCLVLEGVTY